MWAKTLKIEKQDNRHEVRAKFKEEEECGVTVTSEYRQVQRTNEAVATAKT